LIASNVYLARARLGPRLFASTTAGRLCKAVNTSGVAAAGCQLLRRDATLSRAPATPGDQPPSPPTPRPPRWPVASAAELRPAQGTHASARCQMVPGACRQVTRDSMWLWLDQSLGWPVPRPRDWPAEAVPFALAVRRLAPTTYKKYAGTVSPNGRRSEPPCRGRLDMLQGRCVLAAGGGSIGCKPPALRHAPRSSRRRVGAPALRPSAAPVSPRRGCWSHPPLAGVGGPVGCRLVGYPPPLRRPGRSRPRLLAVGSGSAACPRKAVEWGTEWRQVSSRSPSRLHGETERGA